MRWAQDGVHDYTVAVLANKQNIIVLYCSARYSTYVYKGCLLIIL